MEKIVKVSFEMEGGKIKYIEDKELEKWEYYNKVLAEFAKTYNLEVPLNEIKWKELQDDPIY